MSAAPEQVSRLQLEGEPYQTTRNGEAIDCNTSLNILAASAGYAQSLPGRIDEASGDLSTLFEQSGYTAIDRELKHGKDLDFDQAFSLVSFVSASVNRILAREINGRINNLGSGETHLLQGVALLAGMSVKEAYSRFKPDEIAGMAAAAVHLDTVVRTPSDKPVLAFGGMGGDLGYPLEGGQSKLFSLSTLSAVALSVDGNTHKHHSYPNTSKIAGQSAIEAYGARSDLHSPRAFEQVLEESGLLMSSCHNTRALHTVSHRLKGETINHVIGPLAFTMSPETELMAQIGVNEKVHPQTVADALMAMDARGYQKYGNSAIYCGTDIVDVPAEMLEPELYYNSSAAKQHVRLDEIAPPPYSSLVAFNVDGHSEGTFVVKASDFYDESELAKVTLEDLIIPNTKESILHFNSEALSGQDQAKARYLAMTIGMGIFTRKYLSLPDALDPISRRVNVDYLRAATQEGLEVLTSGKAVNQLKKYVDVTQQYAGDK